MLPFESLSGVARVAKLWRACERLIILIPAVERKTGVCHYMNDKQTWFKITNENKNAINKMIGRVMTQSKGVLFMQSHNWNLHANHPRFLMFGFSEKLSSLQAS